MSIEIHRLPAFHDNYLWLVANTQTGEALAIDPGDAAVVSLSLKSLGLHLHAILITHHHPDHIGGLAELKKAFNPRVYGPNTARIPLIETTLVEGDELKLLGISFKVLETPGHTLDHIVYYADIASKGPVLFCGDTLFAAGCGRLFEGTAEQMLVSLEKLCKLPKETQIYCAHEYTLANLKFAVAVEPGNLQTTARLQEVESMRSQGLATIPTNLGVELMTNPFLRISESEVRRAASLVGGHPMVDRAEIFAVIRQWKDRFQAS